LLAVEGAADELGMDYLDFNEVESEGIAHLAKSQWKDLTLFNMSIS